MRSRLELQSTLEELLGTNHVYYQPPENLKIEYPAIIYSLNDIASTYADNNKYKNMKRYMITVIDKKPDNNVIEKILELEYSSYDRHYVSDNFNHDIIVLYF